MSQSIKAARYATESNLNLEVLIKHPVVSLKGQISTAFLVGLKVI